MIDRSKVDKMVDELLFNLNVAGVKTKVFAKVFGENLKEAFEEAQKAGKEYREQNKKEEHCDCGCCHCHEQVEEKHQCDCDGDCKEDCQCECHKVEEVKEEHQCNCGEGCGEDCQCNCHKE